MSGKCDQSQRGSVFWLYGLSGAGKTTLANTAASRLNAVGIPTVVLDGDCLRAGLGSDLGFDSKDRLENVRRAAEIAKLLSEQRFTVLVALMTPLANMRQLAREIVGKNFQEVYVQCDYTVCSQRDPKGLYAKAAAGELYQFPGKDSVFEEPLNPSLILATNTATVESCVGLLLQEIHHRTHC